MRALYLGGFNLPDKNAAAQRVVANAKILRALDYEVRLVGLGQACETFEYEGFSCTNLPYPRSASQWLQYLTSIKRYLLYFDPNPQLVIAYNHPAWALEKLRKYCQRRSIKIVADCTEWYTPEGNVLYKLIKGLDTKSRMEKIQPKLDGIISISRFLHEYYSSHGTKSIQLPPLVDFEEKKWSKTPSFEFDRDQKALKLVYAGSPGHKDRLDTIVNVVIRQNDIRPVFFMIIGLDEAQFRDLYGFTDVIPDYILFKGRMSHGEVLSALRTADFQVFVREENITTRAGFPTKFVESISAGLPVITNLTSNLDEYLVDGRNGFVVDTSSEDALRESFKRVLNVSLEEVETVKATIDCSTFDYRRYVGLMKKFIESI